MAPDGLLLNRRKRCRGRELWRCLDRAGHGGRVLVKVRMVGAGSLPLLLFRHQGNGM